MIASRVGVLATSLMIDNKIKGLGLAAICALSLNGCDRNSSTVAINPTAPSSMSLPSDTTAKPSQANPKSPSATIVIDDSSFIANSPPLPTASQTASIITNRRQFGRFSIRLYGNYPNHASRFELSHACDQSGCIICPRYGGASPSGD